MKQETSRSLVRLKDHVTITLFALAVSWFVTFKLFSVLENKILVNWFFYAAGALEKFEFGEQSFDAPVFFKHPDVRWVLYKQWMTIGGTFLGVYLLGVLWLLFLSGMKRGKQRLVRGDDLMDEQEMAAHMKKVIRQYHEKGPHIYFGKVPWPQSLEGRHLFLLGAPGSGKSTSIGAIIEKARERGESGCCYDPSGDMLAKYYREGDIIFAPFDARCVVWDLRGDAPNELIAQTVGNALVPNVEGSSNNEWRQMAANVVRDLIVESTSTIDFINSLRGKKADIWRKIQRRPSYIMAGADRASDSVIFSLAPAVQAVSTMRVKGGTPFSLREWTLNTPPNSWIWCFLRPSDEGAVKPVLSAFLESLALNLLSLPAEKRKMRRWVIVDEWPTLGKMEAVPRLLYEGRKYGVATVLAAQSLPQVAARYGEQEGSAIPASCGTIIMFRCPPGKAAEEAERIIGQKEISRETRSRGKDSDSLSEQITETKIMTATELAKLPDLHAVVRMGPYGVGRFVSRVWAAQMVCPSWMEGSRDDYIIEITTPQTAEADEGGA